MQDIWTGCLSDRSRLDIVTVRWRRREEGRNHYKQLLRTKVIPVLTSPEGKSVSAILLMFFMLVFTQWVVGQEMTSISLD